MSKRFITPRLLVSASEIFQTCPSTKEERLNLLKSIPKSEIIYALSSFNMRMLRANSTYNNYFSKAAQMREICHFCSYDNEFCQNVFNQTSIVDSTNDNFPIFFCRLSTLLAIREVLEEIDNEDENHNFKFTSDDWLQIFLYLLSMNDRVKEYTNQNINLESSKRYSFFEKIATCNQLINELNMRTHPIAPMSRLVNYVNYLNKIDKYQKFIDGRFTPFGFNAGYFLKQIINLHRKKDSGNGYSCIIDVKETIDKKLVQILDLLSDTSFLSDKIHFFDFKKLTFAPLCKIGKEFYFVMDRDLLIDKVYDHFINDFYTIYLEDNDYIEDGENKEFKIKKYRTDLGLYFEEYISELFYDLAIDDSVLLTLDEMKIPLGSSGEVEVTDIYYRSGNKILTGEVKAKGIGVEQRDGSTFNFLYNPRHDLSKPKDDNYYRFLYKKFGLDQIVKSMDYLKNHNELFDGGIQEFIDKEICIDIYPTIIVNEKFFNTPFMNKIFKDEFDKRLKRSDYPEFNIHQLSILYVEDIEIISSNVVYGKDVHVFNLLRYYTNKSQANSFRTFLDYQGIDFPIEYYNQKFNFIDEIELDD
ncbi:MAG: hypothetical protein DHS20C18_32370 [Saprospiraceae bacterium]|nr:MAG: hypothetical protein DHS20C18_32370 [Saprospiraceae bacterium]